MLQSKRRTVVKVLRLTVGCVVFFLTLNLSINFVRNKGERTSTYFNKLMDETRIENARRISTVESTCKKYNLGIYRQGDILPLFKHPPAPQYTVFYIDRLHNVSYCPIYKAGTTTWIYNLCLLMNVPEGELNSGKQQISTIARRVLPEIEFPDADQALKATKKLLVVRHPFERLLSAYRDKLENSVAGREHGTLHFYRKYGAKIVRNYRGKNFTRPRADQVVQRDGVVKPAGIEPTFREFVQYLINTDLGSYGDDHWMPYYLYCTPCIVSYDIIAKVETLQRDQTYAIEELGLQGKIKPRWRHASGRSDASKIYFGQLTVDLVRRLYEKFRLDFELFDYSPDIYYRYATAPS